VTLEEGIRSYLMTIGDVTNQVGEQIYGIIRPQGIRPLPELLVTRSATRNQQLFCGTNPLRQADMQIDCYAIDGMTCVALAKSVRDALIDFVGMMGDVVVDQVTMENEFAVNDSDPGTIRMVQLYNFWYVED